MFGKISDKTVTWKNKLTLRKIKTGFSKQSCEVERWMKLVQESVKCWNFTSTVLN